jgi:hypothetical protein
LTGVNLDRVGGNGAFDFDNPATTGDDQNLMDDCQNVGSMAGATTTWTFTGLATGAYRLYTYAWSPNSPTAISTVSAGTVSPDQPCGGPWPGTQQLDVTYTVHEFFITFGSPLSVTITVSGEAGNVNGFQLVLLPPPGTYLCFGDGSGTACPNGNNSPPGQQAGCLNSLGMGAVIEALGNPSISADTIHFHGAGMPFGPCLYFQGDGLAAGGSGTTFGNGLLCTSGPVVRLGIKFNGHGSSNFPGSGDPSVSSQGLVSTPGFKYYQVWYRDAAATPLTTNLSRTVCIPWVP